LLASDTLKNVLGADISGLFKRLMIKDDSLLQDEGEIRGLFEDALEFLEENQNLKKEGLLGLEAIKEMILERNLEALPFYEYVRFKYNSGLYKRGSQGRLPGTRHVALNSNSN
jgi:hypothetical protein